jgi:mono/diheme cytochrome c family protein
MKKKLININYCIFVLILLSFQSIKADDLFDQGKKIFLGDGNCATCHALQDANSNGNIGPNLDEIKPDIMRVISAVTNGIGVMPAYEGQL